MSLTNLVNSLENNELITLALIGFYMLTMIFNKLISLLTIILNIIKEVKK